MLLALAAATGARALVLPCGALDHTPLGRSTTDLDLVAAELIARRRHGAPATASSCGPNRCTTTGCAANLERAQALTDRLAGEPVTRS